MHQEALKVLHLRGTHIESEHPVAAVLCRADGSVVRALGPTTVTTWRSGAKPFQLIGSLGFLDPAEVASLSPEDLAVGAASHSGETVHTDRVSELLARFGLDEPALRCGIHWPTHRASERALLRAGRDATQLHNNCSGKHTFMAAASKRAGFDPDYRPSDHPLQKSIRAVVDAHTQGTVVDVVIDGCGAPCFVLPLAGMATAFASLADATQSREGLLGRIGHGMATHPRLVSGTGRSDLSLCDAATTPLIAKVGADGLLCVAIPSMGLGFAMKVLSGHEDARMPAFLAIAERWLPGLLPEGACRSWCEVKNLVGRHAGERTAVWGG